jgi:hypothetical protein
MNNRPNATVLTESRKAQFSVGLPGRQFDQLTRLAREDGQSRSSYAADVLSRHLDRLGRKAA